MYVTKDRVRNIALGILTIGIASTIGWYLVDDRLFPTMVIISIALALASMVITIASAACTDVRGTIIRRSARRIPGGLNGQMIQDVAYSTPMPNWYIRNEPHYRYTLLVAGTDGIEHEVRVFKWTFDRFQPGDHFPRQGGRNKQ